MKSLLALCMGALLLSSCGGGGSHLIPSPSATAKSPGASAKVQVAIRVLVPTAARVRAASNARLAHILSLASTSLGVQVSVFQNPNSTFTNALATSSFAINPTTCPASGANLTCTFTIPAPTGSDVFVFQTYAAAPGSFAAANLTGSGQSTASVTAGTTPTVSITLGGVVSQVAVTLVPNTVHLLDSTNGVAIIVAQDAEGNAIVSTGFVDANGNAQTISLNNVQDVQFTYPSCCTISAPLASGLPFTFTEDQFPESTCCSGNFTSPGTSETVTADVSPLGITGSATLTIVPPTFTPIADSALSVGGSFSGGAAFAGGSLYYSVPNAGIDAITGTTVTSPFASGNTSGGMVLDGTNAVWAAGPGGLYSEAYTSGPAPLSDACPGCQATTGSAVAINEALGPDVYYLTNRDLVDYNEGIDAENPLTTIPVIANGGVAVDPVSNNVWISDNAVGGPVLIVAPGSATCTSLSAGCAFSLSNAASGAEPSDIVYDPNALAGPSMWVADRAGSRILEIPTGSPNVNTTFYTEICCYSTAPPVHLALDPIRPHILWFDAMYNGVLSVGRLDTQNQWLNVVQYPGSTLPANGQPGAIAIDPATDNVYIVYDGGGYVVEVQQ